MPVIPGCPYFEIPYKLSHVLHYPGFVICVSPDVWFILWLVYIVSLLVCQVHHLLCRLFRAESCSSYHVFFEANTIFLESKDWSSVIVKDKYPFILLSLNTVRGFSLPSPSKESKLRTTEEVGFALKQIGCAVTKGLIKNIPPPTNKQMNRPTA